MVKDIKFELSEVELVDFITKVIGNDDCGLKLDFYDQDENKVYEFEKKMEEAGYTLPAKLGRWMMLGNTIMVTSMVLKNTLSLSRFEKALELAFYDKLSKVVLKLIDGTANKNDCAKILEYCAFRPFKL